MTIDALQEKISNTLAYMCDLIASDDYPIGTADAELVKALTEALRVSEMFRNERLKY